MLWKDKIKLWSSGSIQKYPENINKRFFYQTSICDKNLSNEYKEIFITSDKLESITKQDFKPFTEYFSKTKNKYVISFLNLSKTSLLIVPIPREKKIFTTLKDFIDNASKKQQIEFWKHVADCIQKMLTIVDKVYVNTHGLGVYYLHVRIDIKPKYYYNKQIL
jgi:hypothetical protein